MSGNQQGTPSRQSAAGRISTIPSTPQSSSNPRPQLNVSGASGHQRIVNTPLPPNPPLVLQQQGAHGHLQALVPASRSRPQNPRLQPDPNRRFTVTDPTVLARILVLNRQAQRAAASGPSAPIVQSPGPTPAPPQFVLPGQSTCRPPNPSYHYEQVTRALTKPYQTVPRHFHPVISANPFLAAGRTASLDRSAVGTGLSQGTPLVSLLGSLGRRDQSTPPTLSLGADSSFSNVMALAKPGPADGVGLRGQVVAYSDQPRHSEVIDRMFHQPLPNMPAMMTGKSTDYSSTHKMAVTRNYFKGTEEVTYEQSMQHQPPPVPAYYPPMAAGSSSMPQQLYDVGGQYFTQAQIDAAIAEQQEVDQQSDQQRQLAAAVAIVLQAQQQQDDAAGDRANEMLREESEFYHRQEQERKQREQELADQAELRLREEDQIADRLRRVSDSSQRPSSKQTPVDQSTDLFASLSYRKEPTLNELNSVEHSEAGSIADEAYLPNELSQQSDIGNFDGENITETLLDESNGRFAGDEPTAAVVDAASTSGRHSPGSRGCHKGERGMERLTRHLVQASDSDSDSSERPKDKKVERKAVQKLAFNRDVWSDVKDYSDGETELNESQADTGALPPGCVPIPKYDCVLPRYISAAMLTEMLEGVSEQDLAMYVKVIRDNIIGQLDMMNRADVPTIDRPKLTQAEINSKQFLALLDDTDSYQLGMPLPNCIVLPPLYRKIDYYRERCAAGLHEFSEAVRTAGSYIYTFPGQAARRNLKGFGKVRKLRMQDYFEPDEFGHVLPSFSRLKQASSGTREAFTARTCTQEISKIVTQDPEKYRDLLNALQDVGGKLSEHKATYLFKDEEGKPVRILVPEVLSEQIWEAYPDLHIFNREFWRYLQSNHPELVLASYNISQSLINRDQQVAYLGQTNKRGYLGLAFGQQSSAIMPKSTVRMFAHMTPFMRQPGDLVRHSVQHSGRTVNFSVAAEHVEQAMAIEREIYPAEYAKCPAYHLHAKYYNPMLLVEKSDGKIQVGVAILNVGDMLTVLERSMFMQISLGPGETSNTNFLGAYNKTVALSLTSAKREAACLCVNNKRNALLAAETPGRLDAAFHFLASDYLHLEMPDEPENACPPCGLYPVGATWAQRHGQFENHMKAAFDPITGRAIRDACPDPMGLVPKLKRENLTASFTDRRSIEGESKILASVEASTSGRSKGRGKLKAVSTTPRISVAAAKPPPPHHKFRKPRASAKSTKALSIKPPKAKRSKKEIVKKEPTEEEGDAKEDSESGNEAGSESDGEKSDTPDVLLIDEGEQVEAKPGRKRKAAKKSPIIEEPEDDEKGETAAKESSKRKCTTKPIAPPSVDEPATSSKRPKRTPKKADEKTPAKETEKDSEEAAKPATRSSVAAAAAVAKPASQRAKRTNELDSLLKCGVNGKPEPVLPDSYDVDAAYRIAQERGLQFWTDIPTADIPKKPAVVSPSKPKPLSDLELLYDVPAAIKLAKERGLINWTLLPHADIPTKSAIPTKQAVGVQPAPIPKSSAADDSTPGTSTRSSASKATAIKKTPGAALAELKSKTKAASEAAKKADKKAAKGKQYPSKATVSDDDSEDETNGVTK